MYKEKIDEMIFNARKEKKSDVVLVYQDVKNEFLKFRTAEKNVGKELTEDKEIEIIRKMVKARNESGEIYEKAGRPEQAAKEFNEKKILEALLPAGPSEDDIRSTIIKFLDGRDSITQKEMGQAIKFVKENLKGVDGKVVSDIVKTYIK